MRKAANDDRTVIITLLNEAWASPGSIFDLFIESFHVGEKTEELLKHLVVIALDPKAFERCKLVHSYCFRAAVNRDIDLSGEKKYLSHDYLTLMWWRLELLRSVLQLGYNFIFTVSFII